MRLIEKCCCGASIEVIWDESSYYHKGEDKRASKELATFRKAHALCRLSKAAETA